jgi:hypothetical protein
MAKLLAHQPADCIGTPFLSYLKNDNTTPTPDIINNNKLSQYKLLFETSNLSTILLNVYVVPILEEMDIINYMLIMLNEEPKNSTI